VAHSRAIPAASPDCCFDVKRGEGVSVAHALTQLGFTPSNKEAKRKIAEGAVRLDDVPVTDPGLILAPADEPLKLSLGKKRHGLLVR